jgi:hypothetical protein
MLQGVQRRLTSFEMNAHITSLIANSSLLSVLDPSLVPWALPLELSSWTLATLLTFQFDLGLIKIEVVAGKSEGVWEILCVCRLLKRESTRKLQGVQTVIDPTRVGYSRYLSIRYRWHSLCL